MKRRNLLILAMLAVIVSFISCEKDITTTAVKVDTSKVANLKVYVEADLDTTSGNESVPSGTQFIVSVRNSDLNPAYTGTGMWSQTVSANGSGVIELEVPTIDAGVTVYIDAIAFEATYYGAFSTDERVYELVAEAITGVKVNSNRVETRTLTFRTISSVPVP